MGNYCHDEEVPESKQVRCAIKYLEEEMIAWWQRYLTTCKVAGRAPLSTWEELKDEWKGHYMPNNVMWMD